MVSLLGSLPSQISRYGKFLLSLTVSRLFKAPFHTITPNCKSVVLSQALPPSRSLNCKGVTPDLQTLTVTYRKTLKGNLRQRTCLLTYLSRFTLFSFVCLTFWKELMGNTACSNFWPKSFSNPVHIWEGRDHYYYHHFYILDSGFLSFSQGRPTSLRGSSIIDSMTKT